MSVSWTWIPGKSVGPFRLGSRADAIIREEGLARLKGDYLAEEWDSYEVPGYESRVYVEDGVLTSVLCYDSLIYEGNDLIGMPQDDVVRMLGKEDEVEENKGPWTAVYYHGLGLTLWIADGAVESATCERLYESQREPTGPDRSL